MVHGLSGIPAYPKKWQPNENLLKEDFSTIPVWVKLHGVPVTAFSDDGLTVIATKRGTPLMLDSYTPDMCMQSWGRSSYARVMIELQDDVELKITFSLLCLELRGRAIIYLMSMLSMSGNLLGVRLVRFLDIFKRNVQRIQVPVSNSNPFEVLSLVDKDVKLGMNGGTTNLVNNEATSSRSSFMNIDNSSTNTTHVIDDYDSEDEVTLVDNDMGHSMASKRDFNKKFYNSIGRVPNRCSSIIGKTRVLLSFSRRIGLMIRKYFIAYTKTNVLLFHATLIQHMESIRESILERAKHKREKDRRVNDRMMQSKERKDNSSKALDVGLVVTESNDTESKRRVLSSRSQNDTPIDDVDINSVNDKQPMAKVDRNTTPESTDISHRGGEIDQNADVKKFQVSCPLPDPSVDNMITKFSNQLLESENISLKKTVAQL
nr:hypothetical protein [Tanacetum cinerariifolium]